MDAGENGDRGADVSDRARPMTSWPGFEKLGDDGGPEVAGRSGDEYLHGNAPYLSNGYVTIRSQTTPPTIVVSAIAL